MRHKSPVSFSNLAMPITKSSFRILHSPLITSIFRFGLPLAVGMALQNAFNLVDAYLISLLPGDEVQAAVGALGVCDQIAALGTIVSYGVSTATATLVSTQRGAGNDESVGHTARHSITIVAILSLLYACVGFGSDFIVREVIGVKGMVANVAAPYLRVILAGSFSIFFLLHFTSIQRALGSSITPVALLVVGNVFNLLFAVVCLYGPVAPAPFLSWGATAAKTFNLPHLGLVGAAWATVAARALVLIPTMVVLASRFDLFRSFSKLKFRPDLKELRRIAKLAWPTSIQFVLRILGMLFVNSLVARFFSSESNQTSTTAMGVVFRVDTMALFVAMGWGSAAQTFVGQNGGAGHSKRALRSGIVAAIYDVFTNLVLMAALFLFAEQILFFFGKDTDVVRIGTSYLHIVAPSYVGLGVGIVLGSAMAGMGATKLTMWIDMIILFFVLVPMSLFAVIVLRVSLQGLFGCVAFTNMISAAAYIWVYTREKWLTSSPYFSSGIEDETGSSK